MAVERIIFFKMEKNSTPERGNLIVRSRNSSGRNSSGMGVGAISKSCAGTSYLLIY
jgi:hypothetical protein